MRPIDVIHTVTAMQEFADRARRENKTLAFVPTMGFLHEGHLSLMRIARENGDLTAVSIFVNPAQFGPGEDFDTYPRAPEKDLDLCRDVGVDVVFVPDTAELYASGFQTYVRLEHLPNHLCGLSRPVFFQGVATVVTKLFHIVKPHVAIFGEKDYQQLQVIRQMVRDLNMDIRIIGGPIVREPDGLAMSSRNAYLKPDQRSAALTLVRSLEMAASMVESGETSADRIRTAAEEQIRSVPGTDIDYVRIVDPETLEEIVLIDGPVCMALAVKVGDTRIIDNRLLCP